MGRVLLECCAFVLYVQNLARSSPMLTCQLFWFLCFPFQVRCLLLHPIIVKNQSRVQLVSQCAPLTMDLLTTALDCFFYESQVFGGTLPWPWKYSVVQTWQSTAYKFSENTVFLALARFFITPRCPSCMKDQLHTYTYEQDFVSSTHRRTCFILSDKIKSVSGAGITWFSQSSHLNHHWNSMFHLYNLYCCDMCVVHHCKIQCMLHTSTHTDHCSFHQKLGVETHNIP